MDQILVLLWLRYRLLIASVYRNQNPWDQWLVIISFSMALIFSLVLGLLAFGSLYFLILPRSNGLILINQVISSSLWIIVWFQVLLAVIAQSTGTAAAFDPRRFLLLPIRLERLFALNFLTGYADLSCWLFLPTLTGIFLAPALYFAQPGILVSWLLAVLWLGMVSLTLNLGLVSLLGSGGSRKEALTALAIGVVAVLPQIWVLLGVRFPGLVKAMQAWFKPWIYLLELTPPQALGKSLALDLSSGFLVFLWLGALGGLSYGLFRRLALGSEGQTSRSVTTQWNLLAHLGTGTLGALVGKQLLYIGRNPLSYFLILPVAIVFTTVSLFVPAQVIRAWGEVLAILGVSNIYIFSAQLFNSTFAFDGQGFKTYMLAPVPWQQVLLAHNLSFGLWILGQLLLGLGLTQCLVGGLSPSILLCSFLALIIFGVTYSLVGNWFSIYFPVRLVFGVQARQGTTSAALILAPVIGLGLNVLVLGPLLLIGLGSVVLHNPLILYGGLICATGLMILIYPAGLEAQDRVLQERQDLVLAALITQN